MKKLLGTALIGLLGFFGIGAACGQNSDRQSSETPEKNSRSMKEGSQKTPLDTVSKEDAKTRYSTLTDADFKKVADRLGVEVAAIKAVVVIEAGAKMEGFWAPGVPVVNFDRSMYNRYKSKCSSKGNPKEKVPSGLSGYALQEWTQLCNARKSTVDGANMGTFWGMFQIGGFNYKACGCESVEEMVKLMSYSELEQLELFATFLINTGMVNDLKNKNWAAFARKYNGSSYAKRGYHTKMANAYARFKK